MKKKFIVFIPFSFILWNCNNNVQQNKAKVLDPVSDEIKSNISNTPVDTFFLNFTNIMSYDKYQQNIKDMIAMGKIRYSTVHDSYSGTGYRTKYDFIMVFGQKEYYFEIYNDSFDKVPGEDFSNFHLSIKDPPSSLINNVLNLYEAKYGKFQKIISNYTSSRKDYNGYDAAVAAVHPELKSKIDYKKIVSRNSKISYLSSDGKVKIEFVRIHFLESNSQEQILTICYLSSNLSADALKLIVK